MSGASPLRTQLLRGGCAPPWLAVCPPSSSARPGPAPHQSRPLRACLDGVRPTLGVPRAASRAAPFSAARHTLEAAPQPSSRASPWRAGAGEARGGTSEGESSEQLAGAPANPAPAGTSGGDLLIKCITGDAEVCPAPSPCPPLLLWGPLPSLQCCHLGPGALPWQQACEF